MNPIEYDTVRVVSQPRNSFVPPPPSVRIITFRPGRDASIPGIAASACRVTAMWSSAVFDPALPFRSSIANASPVPDEP